MTKIWGHHNAREGIHSLPIFCEELLLYGWPGRLDHLDAQVGMPIRGRGVRYTASPNMNRGTAQENF